jgi:hypothetical protein
MRSRGDDFKPIQAEFRLTAKAACDYTNRPEVTAASPAVAGSSPSEGSATPIVADEHGGDLDVRAERLGTIVLPTLLAAAEDSSPEFAELTNVSDMQSSSPPDASRGASQ